MMKLTDQGRVDEDFVVNNNSIRTNNVAHQ